MLFKKIVQTYGATVAGKPPAAHDMIAQDAPSAALMAFRQQALDDISAAVVYVLDAEAADYADSFRESMMENTFTLDAALKVTRVLAEVELPHELIWVEHDHADLTRDRVRRGHDDGLPIDPDSFGTFGFLIDDRSPDFVKITRFRTAERGSNEIIDPLLHIRFIKADDGSVKMDGYVPEFHEHMVAYYDALDLSKERGERLIDHEGHITSYECMLAYIVFALIASRDNGIVREERASLTRSEEKTARKFGKTWMTDILRSHITIRIGEEARRHLAEQSARKSHERAQSEGRLPPTEHWVSEHERHYKSGKVVLIQRHKRGTKPDDSLPRMVVGPKRR